MSVPPATNERPNPITDKPKYTLLPVAMIIIQTQGEDAAQHWYNALSEEQKMAYSEEAATFAESFTASFQPIVDIWRKQAEVTIAAFTAFAEKIGAIDKDKTNPM